MCRHREPTMSAMLTEWTSDTEPAITAPNPQLSQLWAVLVAAGRDDHLRRDQHVPS
jgi:hypothetical protein